MNCFHAENSHFSIQFLTYEEGFIAFLNISVRHAKNVKRQILDGWFLAGIDFVWCIQALSKI